eukprot:18635-Rhodomonas_salina.1
MPVRQEVQPIGSSVDVGWRDGQPRPVSEDAGRRTGDTISCINTDVVATRQRPRVQEEEKEGRIPRPRSQHAPKPANLVNYGHMQRNANDNIDLAGPNIDKLMMTNAENMSETIPVPRAGAGHVPGCHLAAGSGSSLFSNDLYERDLLA